MTRRMTTTVLALTAALVLLAAPVAGAQRTALGTLVNLRHTSVGTILVTAHGYTLYAFSPDHRNQDTCVHVRDCLSLWPALSTKAKPRAGHGVKGRLLGTIRLPGGRHQITYAGHPLYTYVPDTGPGDVKNVNIFQFGGTWPALNAAGHLVT